MSNVIFRGNHAVVIHQQDGHVWACYYVNARDGIENATICSLRFSGKTMAGALRWANKHLPAEVAA